MHSGALIAFVLILALLAAACLIVVIRRKRLRDDLGQLSPEDRQRHDAILAADKAIKQEQKAYDAGVRAAQYSLNQARVPRVLTHVGNAIVTETNIMLNGSPRLLTPGVTAQVEATGDVQKYTTVHSSGGKVVNTVRTSDTRELYLTVTGPGWQDVVQLQPDLGAQAREFAATLYNVSPRAEHHRQQYHARLDRAELSHRAAIVNTEELNAAKQARLVLELDPLDELRKARKQARHDARAVRS